MYATKCWTCIPTTRGTNADIFGVVLSIACVSIRIFLFYFTTYSCSMDDLSHDFYVENAEFAKIS